MGICEGWEFMKNGIYEGREFMKDGLSLKVTYGMTLR